MIFARSFFALAPLLAAVANTAECDNWAEDMTPFIKSHEDTLWSLR